MQDLQLGLTMTAMGMGMVFAVLILLALVLTVVNRFFEGHQADNGVEDGAIHPVMAGGAALTAGGLSDGKEEEGAHVGEGLAPSLVAAVVAVVAGYLDRPINTLKVVGLRRLEGAEAEAAARWAVAGRQEVMEARINGGRKGD